MRSNMNEMDILEFRAIMNDLKRRAINKYGIKAARWFAE